MTIAARPFVRGAAAAGLAAALLVGPARSAGAADGAKFALLVTGASGEEQYAVMHRRWLDAFVALFRDKYKYDASHLIVLTETPKAGEEKATAEGVKTALARIAAAAQPVDQVSVVLIGHGSGDGPDAKFNLVGPDLSAAEWAKLVEPIKAHLVFIDTTSASFPYLAGLSAPGRVVITATNSYAQRFHTVFADALAKALSSDVADEDKNGRISLLEAFNYASRLVKEHYDQAGTMATELAAIDDNGDGTGRVAADKGPDGTIAAVTYLDNPATPTSSDPETERLLIRQRQLTDAIDDLRRRQSSLAPDDFDKQMEALVTELAQVSRDIRQRTGSR